MRWLFLLLFLALPVGAQTGAPTYTCLGVQYQLPVDFTLPKTSAMFEACEQSYPGDNINSNYKLAVARLPAEKADKKDAWFDLAYKALISMRGLAPTGKTRTFLGQPIQELGGDVRQGFDSGRSLAYLIPLPDGGFLFIGFKGWGGYSDGDLDKMAQCLSASLTMAPQ